VIAALYACAGIWLLVAASHAYLERA